MDRNTPALFRSSRMRRTRTGIAVALAVSAATVLSGCSGGSFGATTAESDDAGLSIGFIVPATGPVSSIGLAMQAGFELGVEKVNAEGGVGGADIVFDAQDDGGDPASTTLIARRFAQDPAVDLLFGTVAGDAAAAVAPIADESEIPFATAVYGDPSVCSVNWWPFGASNRQLLQLQVANLIAQYGPRIAFVGSDYNFPHDVAVAATEIIAANGGELVAEEYSPLGTTDFSATISRLAGSEPDAVLSYVVGSDAVTFAQQGQQFGLLTDEMGLEGAALDADYYPAVADLVDGRQHVTRWADGLEDDDSAAFVAAYRAKTDTTGPVPETAAIAYYAIQFIAAAANSADATTREGLSAALADFSYDSPLGEGTHFESTGASNLFQADMFTYAIADGAYTEAAANGLVDDQGVSCR